MTKNFLILGALDAEIDEYRKRLNNPKETKWKEFTFYEGQFCGQNIIVVKSGVGKVFAAMVTQKLIELYDPKGIIFTGVAGSLNRKHKIGDVLVAKDCVQHDFNATGLGFSRGTIPYTDYKFFKTDEHLFNLALSAESEYNIHSGRILTGDQFLTKKEIDEYDYLTDELGGDAVEMEGASVGQVCTINEVPFLIIRTISDKADEDAPIDFNNFLPIVAKNSVEIVSHILNNY